MNCFLFADPEQEYNQFYKCDVDWSNRLILGDSLQVMSSLARREDLAGKAALTPKARRQPCFVGHQRSVPELFPKCP